MPNMIEPRRRRRAISQTAAQTLHRACCMIEPLEDRMLLSVSLISVNSGGTDAGNAASGTGNGGALLQPAISANGRYVAFVSNATDLGANDNNSASDVFLRDTQTNTTTLISEAADNSGSGNGASGDVVSAASVSPTGGVGISADGRYVVFVSSASNLVANDTNNAPDVFVRDTQNGTTSLVSIDATGNSAAVAGGSAGSYDPVISDDGRYVAFVSTANNLSGANSADANAPDVFLRDTQAAPGTTGAVTQLTTAITGGTGTATSPSISNDGKYVAFISSDQLVAGTPANGHNQLFVYDNSGGANNGTVTLASPDAAGTAGAGADVTSAQISGNGRSVAFVSNAGDLVSGFTDSNANGGDVYVRSLDANTTTLVSKSTTSSNTTNVGGNGASYAPAISTDGTVVAYASDASDLAPSITDNNNARDIYVTNVTTGTTSLASVDNTGGASSDMGADTTGTTGGATSLAPALSGNGRYVVFSSSSTNITPPTTTSPLPTAVSSLYVRDNQSGTTTQLTPELPNAVTPTPTSGAVGDAAISRDGSTVAFVGDRSNLISGTDTNSASDVFTATVASPTPTPTPTPTGASGDLGVTVAGNLPMSLVSGTQAKLTPVVTVTNTGPDTVRGPVMVGFFLSTDQTLDAGDSALTTTTKNLRLKGGKAKNIKVKLGALPAVPDGTYYLLSQLTTGTTITDPNVTNNVAATAQPITLAAPFVDLSGTLDSVPASATRGKKTTIRLSILNGGNITAKGPISIAVAARPVGATDATLDVPLKTFATRLNLKASGTKHLRLKYPVPTTLAAGDYNVVVQIDSANQLPESNETNNTVISTGTFTAV